MNILENYTKLKVEKPIWHFLNLLKVQKLIRYFLNFKDISDTNNDIFTPTHYAFIYNFIFLNKNSFNFLKKSQDQNF